MLKVIDFIKHTPDWRKVLEAAPYNLSINDDGGFTILKYSQVDSDFTCDIVRECRGIIIDEAYNPVCVPFFKFANYGEPYADKIDWATARVEEKIDGSLIKVWNYKGNWIVSTNGTIFAENANIDSVCDYKHRGHFSNYAELFNAAVSNAGLDLDSLNPQYTYMFELCSPYNRVVAPHHEIKIYHIGTRDNTTLRELEIDIGIPKPKTYHCNDMNDLIEMASKLKYSEEGYVVKDGDYRRVKVKSPSYVAAHYLINNMNDKKLLELLRKNETAEFLAYFPEYEEFIDNLRRKISALEAHVNDTLKKRFDNLHFETRKDFAAVAMKTDYPGFFFSYFDKKVSTPAEWIWTMSNDKILKCLARLTDTATL